MERELILCDWCGEPIYTGSDAYRTDNGGYVHEHCIDEWIEEHEHDILDDWKIEHKEWIR